MNIMDEKTKTATKAAVSLLQKALRLDATKPTSSAHATYVAELCAAEIQQAHRLLGEVTAKGGAK